jgi:hypothetical protein
MGIILIADSFFLWHPSRLPHCIFIIRLDSLFVYDGIDYTLDGFFLEKGDFILRTVAIVAALYQFDVLKIIYLWDDNVFLKVGQSNLYRFAHLRPLHYAISK